MTTAVTDKPRHGRTVESDDIQSRLASVERELGMLREHNRDVHDQAQDCERLRKDWEASKEVTSGKKKAYDDAVVEYVKLGMERPTLGPLFDQTQPKPNGKPDEAADPKVLGANAEGVFEKHETVQVSIPKSLNIDVEILIAAASDGRHYCGYAVATRGSFDAAGVMSKPTVKGPVHPTRKEALKAMGIEIIRYIDTLAKRKPNQESNCFKAKGSVGEWLHKSGASDTADPEKIIASVPAAKTESKDAPKAEKFTEDPVGGERWRNVSLDDLGILNQTAELLRANKPPLTTLGAIMDWRKTKKLTDISGVGDAKASEIKTLLDKYWKANPLPKNEALQGSK